LFTTRNHARPRSSPGGDAGVLIDAQLRGIGEHDHHVGALDRPERALRREDLHLVHHLALLAEPAVSVST